jgi:hypothetical protein
MVTNFMKLMRLRISRKRAYCIIAVALLLNCLLGSASAQFNTNYPPRLAPPVLKNGNIQLLIFDGRWGQTNIVEVSTDLVRWTPVSTNVFPHTLCPICPYIIFQDSLTNSARRFYRARNL